ncbi:MAG: DoxX family protein [Thiohalomonadales bacterium]
MEKYANLTARILMALIFLMAGLNKIGGYEGTQGYMESVGAPGMLLPLVIIVEVGGAVLLIIGWKVRYSAYALAIFTLLAGFLFHSNFADKMQLIMFMKNIAMVGGLIAIAGLPISKSISLDHKFMQAPAS